MLVSGRVLLKEELCFDSIKSVFFVVAASSV